MGEGDGTVTRNPGRVRRVTPTLAALAVLALAGQAGAGTEALGSDVWFLRDGRPAAVHRTAPGVPGLVRALLAGPTRRERSTGLGSAIPTGTALRDLRIERRVVTVDLAARFVAGRTNASLSARVGQLVRTLRAVPGVVGVRVRIEGGVAVGIFPGSTSAERCASRCPKSARPTCATSSNCSPTSGSWPRPASRGPPGTRPRSPCSRSRSGRACHAPAWSTSR